MYLYTSGTRVDIGKKLDIFQLYESLLEKPGVHTC